MVSNKEEREWQGNWIWLGETSQASNEMETAYFRREFDVPEENCSLTIDVSADSRYRLYLNGESISIGPCKGDRNSHYYETIDVSEKLVAGQKNVLAAQVIHFPLSQPYKLGDGPISVWRSVAGGFFLEGSLLNQQGETIAAVHTDEQWIALRDCSLQFEVESWLTMFLGGVERVDGRQIPHGWQQPNFEARLWTPAKVVAKTKNSHGILSPWQLESRPIPFLYEEARDFKRVMRGNHALEKASMEEEAFYQHGRSSTRETSLSLAAHSRYEVELDAGLLTTGYLRFACSAGQGSKISILSAECYESEEAGTHRRIKGVRDDLSEGQFLKGDSDIYHVAGVGQADPLHYEIYEPFFFRTFRFVKLVIEVGDKPLQLHQFYYRETGYPLDVKGSFSSSDDSFVPLWDISINTLQRCMHESYEDCPYYEQLQYIMDTRLQILFTYYVSGDDRLARKAIKDFHNSMLPSGMLQSRYPSVEPQVIPGFALYWISMVYDHYTFFADRSLAHSYLHTVDAVLGWFEDYRLPSGLVGKMSSKYWNFVDWVEEWKDNGGVPSAYEEGPITAYSMMYSTALEQAAQLNEWLGRKDTAEEYRTRVKEINEALRTECWSVERQLFRDGPTVEQYSQHCQLWAVLAQVVTDEQATQLMERMLVDQSLPKVSYAMSYFLFRALREAGLYHKSFDLWDTWRDMVALNLTTWVEEPVGQRSDCHAWGAVPLYDFPAEILGIKPLEPGFTKILVEPQLGHLQWAQGKVPTLAGEVKVRWEIEVGQFQIEIEAPSQVELQLHLPDGSKKTYQTPQRIKAACSL